MAASLIPFDPQPHPSELPPTLASPFSTVTPHALARRAAEELEARLRAGTPLSSSQFAGVHGGKMFGVLVVADAAGRVGYLRGFSGMVGDSWEVTGFVGPLFDPHVRDAFWPAGQAALAGFDRRLQELACHPEAAAARVALSQLKATHDATAAALAEVHETRRRQRQHQRAIQWPRDDLARESRADTVAERQQRKDHRLQREPFARVLRDLEEQQALTKARQVALSHQLRDQLYAGYQIDNFRGQRRSLRELFAPTAPPGGAGDCAAPKLFAHALREHLRPLALAEFWVGTPSSHAGRHAGTYHPACRTKCGPVLDHMLDGLTVDPADPAIGTQQ